MISVKRRNLVMAEPEVCRPQNRAPTEGQTHDGSRAGGLGQRRDKPVSLPVKSEWSGDALRNSLPARIFGLLPASDFSSIQAKYSARCFKAQLRLGDINHGGWSKDCKNGRSHEGDGYQQEHGLSEVRQVNSDRKAYEGSRARRARRYLYLLLGLRVFRKTVELYSDIQLNGRSRKGHVFLLRFSVFSQHPSPVNRGES